MTIPAKYHFDSTDAQKDAWDRYANATWGTSFPPEYPRVKPQSPTLPEGYESTGIVCPKRRRPADRPTPPAKAPETLLDQKRVSDLTLEEYERLLFKNSVVGQLVLFFRGLLAFLFWIVAQVCMGLFLIFAVAAITDHEINAIVFWGMVFLFVMDCLGSYGVLRCSPSKGCTKVLGVLSGVALVLMYLLTFVALGLMLGSWWSATTWMLLICFGPALALLLLAFMVSGTSKLAKSG